MHMKHVTCEKIRNVCNEENLHTSCLSQCNQLQIRFKFALNLDGNLITDIFYTWVFKVFFNIHEATFAWDEEHCTFGFNLSHSQMVFSILFWRSHFADKKCWQTVIHKFYSLTVMVLVLPRSVRRAVAMEWWRGRCSVSQQMVRKATGALKTPCPRPEKSAGIQAVSTARHKGQGSRGYTQVNWMHPEFRH